ncbi:MAG: hypothetical protein KGJ36_00595 [Acidobacteriota bacterium]|nr:hypothetical protein [Acidobacteriota bacterium]
MTTQGHEELGVATGAIRTSQLRPRRSVVAGSVASLVVGVILASTALPAFARTLVANPTTTLLATSTTTTPTTTVATTTTTVPARHAARVVLVAQPTTHRSVRSSDGTAPTTSTPTTTVPAPTTTVQPTTTTTAPKPVPKPVPNVALRLGSNIAPDPNFLSSGTGTMVNGVATYQNPCVVNGAWPHVISAAACDNYVLLAINNARAIEGVKPMVLPSNWYSLSTQQQLFVVADLERVDRGLPPYLGLNAALSSAAQHAAATKSDPSIASGFPIGTDAQGSPAFGGAWAGGFSVLVADYVWMYDDGWGGANNTSNIVCTSPGAAGCWAHRDELLGSDPGYNPGVGLGCTTCEMGTGFALVGGTAASFVDLIEMPKSGQPAMTFTWDQEQAYF